MMKSAPSPVTTPPTEVALRPPFWIVAKSATACFENDNRVAERPGRIYEGKQKDINLITEAQELAEKSAELSKRKLAKE
jgi:hypothetical protein